MALRTAIQDQGSEEPRTMPHGWGWWHVERMAEVIRIEAGVPDETTLAVLNRCPWVVQQEHTFVDESDGEVFTLHPGDTLAAWRDR